ncbi:hypothetical protein CAPTEDRAFT_110959 [Capitella teleta]|uniref:Small monomeric GTPase n=1 Tax=Capitella teleta TaxID=283909 RepID=R7V4J4_CAPTE|nr:hypothetical protein CAPTEDRAFT_110959 [Capitella teleta]|eukprot:ELU13392.1 hypothetical protein CAPTEDRAFT_110959 [Capitella teleta]
MRDRRRRSGGQDVHAVSVGEQDISKRLRPTNCDCQAHVYNLVIDHQPVLLDLHDTSGVVTYDQLRPMSYLKTDIFVVVYEVVSDEGLNNVVRKWIPKVRHHCPDAPFILVGNKADLREPEMAIKRDESQLAVVSKQEGEKFAQEVGAVAYMECSAFKQDGMTEVFEAAVRIVREQPPKTTSKCCVS